MNLEKSSVMEAMQTFQVEEQSKRREEKQLALKKQEEAWKVRAAKKAEAQSRAFAAEAARLEAALEAAAAGTGLLPQLVPGGVSSMNTSASTGMLQDANAALHKLANELAKETQGGA
jgi:hypothetical protein